VNRSRFFSASIEWEANETGPNLLCSASVDQSDGSEKMTL